MNMYNSNHGQCCAGKTLVTHARQAEMGQREEVGPSQEGHEMLPQESDKLSPNLKAEKRLNRSNRCF